MISQRTAVKHINWAIAILICTPLLRNLKIPGEGGLLEISLIPMRHGNQLINSTRGARKRGVFEIPEAFQAKK